MTSTRGCDSLCHRHKKKRRGLAREQDVRLKKELLSRSGLLSYSGLRRALLWAEATKQGSSNKTLRSGPSGSTRNIPDYFGSQSAAMKGAHGSKMAQLAPQEEDRDYDTDSVVDTEDMVSDPDP